MQLQELTFADLEIDIIYEPIKFRVLQRTPYRVRKTEDDGVTATVEFLDSDDNVSKTEQFETTKHIWKVNL